MSDSTVARRSTGARTVPRTLTTTTNPLPSIVATLPPPPPSLSRTPTKCLLYFTATEPLLLRVVVSSPLFIPPSPREESRRKKSVCTCVLLPFLRPSLFLPSPLLLPPCPTTGARLPSSPSFVRFLPYPPRAPITRSLFPHGGHSFLPPRDGLVTRLHRSPLFVRHPLRIPPLLFFSSFVRSSPRVDYPCDPSSPE